MTDLIAAVDVGYPTSGALGAGVLFEGWGAEETEAETTVTTEVSSDYVAGAFYRRELPVIRDVLEALPKPPTTVIVDGYVWLEGGRPGLGAHLWEALDQSVRVVGVAKNAFRGAPCTELLRGKSTKPIYITAAGIEAGEAALHVAAMHGAFRIPTLLRRVDALSRGRRP